jgi:uncharacterized protein (TIGR03086 family)
MDALRTADLLHPVLLDLAGVVDGIGEDQLSAPTPCTEFDVRTLRNHVIAWVKTFADGYSDPDGQAPVAQTRDYEAPPDAGEVVREAADRLDAAIRAGAGERPFKIGESGMPGETALSMVLWEYLVHGSDLAKATTQPWTPSDDAAQAALEFAPGMLTPEYQGEGKPFAPRVVAAEDSSPMDRLLALSGRSPDWTPGSS